MSAIEYVQKLFKQCNYDQKLFSDTLRENLVQLKTYSGQNYEIIIESIYKGKIFIYIFIPEHVNNGYKERCYWQALNESQASQIFENPCMENRILWVIKEEAEILIKKYQAKYNPCIILPQNHNNVIKQSITPINMQQVTKKTHIDITITRTSADNTTNHQSYWSSSNKHSKPLISSKNSNNHENDNTKNQKDEVQLINSAKLKQNNQLLTKHPKIKRHRKRKEPLIYEYFQKIGQEKSYLTWLQEMIDSRRVYENTAEYHRAMNIINKNCDPDDIGDYIKDLALINNGLTNRKKKNEQKYLVAYKTLNDDGTFSPLKTTPNRTVEDYFKQPK